MSELILPLEQQIPSRELCEQLRDAGFPQDTFLRWFEMCEGEWFPVSHMEEAWPEFIPASPAAPLVGEMRHWLWQQHIHVDDYPRRPGEWLGNWVICPHDGLWHRGRVWDSDLSDANAHALTCLALLKAMSEQPQDSG